MLNFLNREVVFGDDVDDLSGLRSIANIRSLANNPVNFGTE
jgi:hypothetical protein